MKTFVLLLSAFSLTSAYVDLSNIRPIELLLPSFGKKHPLVKSLKHTGITPDKRVVNGEEAFPGQFPYQVLVAVQVGDATGVCGGSVLSQNYVLTAAHCVEYAGTIFPGAVILGVHNRQLEEPTQQQIDFGSVNVHPDWDFATIRYDVATIQLSSPAVFNDYVQPIELPAISDTRSFAGIIGTISGFGRYNDESGSPPSDVLRFTRNPILTNANCQSQISDFPLAPQHICFSGAGSRSVCHGDSGGPLTIQEGERTVQVGIASFVFAVGCSLGAPSGYVRVTNFLDWIAENSDVVLRS